MTQQGAALQNYNNELVKCARPRGGAPWAGGEGVASPARRARAVVGSQRAAECVVQSVSGCSCPGGASAVGPARRTAPVWGPPRALGICGASEGQAA